MNESRWLELMDELGIDQNLNTYKLLLSQYNEKHRSYHNINHIDAVLGHLDNTKHLANNANLVELALWFHDAIYKRFSSTNELDSADWASAFLDENGVGKVKSKRVHSLIMATLHNAIPKDNDEQLLVDIDLSILGSESGLYDQFERWIRQEYKLVPSIVYKKKRKEILVGFLERDRIYSHEHFYIKLEDKARSNISNAIKGL